MLDLIFIYFNRFHAILFRLYRFKSFSDVFAEGVTGLKHVLGEIVRSFQIIDTPFPQTCATETEIEVAEGKNWMFDSGNGLNEAPPL